MENLIYSNNKMLYKNKFNLIKLLLNLIPITIILSKESNLSERQLQIPPSSIKHITAHTEIISNFYNIQAGQEDFRRINSSTIKIDDFIIISCVVGNNLKLYAFSISSLGAPIYQYESTFINDFSVMYLNEHYASSSISYLGNNELLLFKKTTGSRKYINSAFIKFDPTTGFVNSSFNGFNNRLMAPQTTDGLDILSLNTLEHFLVQQVYNPFGTPAVLVYGFYKHK